MSFLLFKQSSIQCKTEGETKLISSKIQHLPYLIQCNKGPSFIDNPVTEFESATYFFIKSFIFVSAFKLYFTDSLPRDLHIISAERVLDVPVGPSKIK